MNIKLTNPHFDHQRVVWKDEYSGFYEPVEYSQQFDEQWRLFLEKKLGFTNHTGVETDDVWINDRIYDLTGERNFLQLRNNVTDRNTGGRQRLDLRFSTDYFKGRKCLDAACGAGRWTRALQALGANVKSIDVSEYGLNSVRRFNKNAENLDIFKISDRKDFQAAFDFTINWGVVMCTHDPKLAFQNVASTVRSGGGLYIMVYAPSYHNHPDVLRHREIFSKLETFEKKLEYVYSIADSPQNAINYMDMLNTFYNWVIPEEIIHNWYRENGFVDVITLNASERRASSYHVFGRKRLFEPSLRDDHGNILPRESFFNKSSAVTLEKPYIHNGGYAYAVNLSRLQLESDNLEDAFQSRLVLLENGVPLWGRHSTHEEIRNKGLGLYSHWNDALIFSTSDNSDPNSNGRNYEWAITDSSD